MYKAKNIEVILKNKRHSKKKKSAASNRWNALKEKKWVSLSRDKHYWNNKEDFLPLQSFFLKCKHAKKVVENINRFFFEKDRDLLNKSMWQTLTWELSFKDNPDKESKRSQELWAGAFPVQHKRLWPSQEFNASE